MINRCKHNPCCGDQTFCSRPRGGWPEQSSPVLAQDDVPSYLVTLLRDRGEPTAAQLLVDYLASPPSPAEVTEEMVEAALIAYWGSDIQAHYVAMGMDGHKSMKDALTASLQLNKKG